MPAGSYKYNGREVVFYHGTRGKIDAFEPLSYFTSSEKAAKRYGKNLYKAYLHLANPLMLVGSPGTTDYYLFIDMTEAKMREYQEFGYDSVIYEGRLEDTDDEEMISAVIFDTAQVEEVGGLFHGGQLPSVCNKLYKDHHEVWDQMDEIEKNLSAGTASKYAGEILRLADGELLSHFYEEEKELFPGILTATNKKDIDELIAQHKELEKLIDTIEDHKRPSDILLFCKQIKEHIKKEESLMSAVTPDPFKKPSKKKLPGTITRIAGRSQKKAGGYVDNGEEKTLLSLFDFSGAWSKPFADAGWNVIQWDIKLSEFMDINLLDSAETVLEMFEDVNGVLAAVPCTDFASSGAQYWEIKDEDGRTHQSVEMVNQVMRIVNLFAPTDPEYDGVWFWAIENPVGRMDKLVSINRKPWYFHPYEFADWLHLSKKDLAHLEQLRDKNGIGLTRADALFVQQTNAYTKKTGLWGDFAIPEKKPIDPVYAIQGKTRTSPIAALTGGKGAKTKELRSNTPLGFAQAFFEANHNYRAQFQQGYWVDLGWSEKEERKILADYNRAEPGEQKKLFASGGSITKNYETTIHSNALKNWFGDWEPAYNLQQNDPAIDAVSIANLNKTVSKVVDPTGKPLVVYHFNTEGNNDFTEFKPQSFGSYGENSMFYFATDKNWVKQFVKRFAPDITNPKSRAFFLDIKKPLDLAGVTLTPSEWIYFLKAKNLLTDYIATGLKNTPESPYYRTELFSWQIFRYDFGDFRKKLIENGYDGIKITDSNYGSKGSNISYVAIYPHQIKIADGSNATFDASSPDIRLEAGGLVESSSFKEWFDGSKVITQNGKPLVVYHGSNSKLKFNVFQKNKIGSRYGADSEGFFFVSDKETASYYSKEGNLYSVYLSIKAPLIINIKGYDVISEWDLSQGTYLKDLKPENDGVILIGKDKYGDETYNLYVVFEPSQIKLADGTNTTFDGSNPDIRFGQGGAIPERYINMGFEKVGEKKQSTAPEKKWMVLAKKGEHYKIVHGGQKGMKDFSQHRSEERRKKFWQRMGGENSTKAKDPFSPLYWHKKFKTWEHGGVLDDHTIKVAWPDSEKSEVLESRMFTDLDKAKQFAEEKTGGNYFIMELTSQHKDNYKWKLLPYGMHLKYKTAVFLNKFLPPFFSDGGIMQSNDLLLAPNGKPTNLTPEQYHLVRTPAFKAWFGDWELSPATASKMVDDNGEPLVCYHGTPNKFNVFRKDVGHMHDAGFYGSGFYFTFNKEKKWMRLARGEASYYGNEVMDCFLKTIKPFDISSLSVYKGKQINAIGAEALVFLYNIAIKFPDLAESIFLDKKTYNPEENEYDITKVPISILPGLIKKYAELLKTFNSKDQHDEPTKWGYVKSEVVSYVDKDGKTNSWESTENLGPYSFKIDPATSNQYPSDVELELYFVEEALEKYEGIEASYYPEGYMTRNPQITEAIMKNHDAILQSEYGDEIVVFEPTQIKLADGTNTTFDGINSDIRFKTGGLVKSDAFQKWFAGSKVVDKDGNPLVVYHGTQAPDFSVFQIQQSPANESYGSEVTDNQLGFFFTDKKLLAEQFAGISYFHPDKEKYVKDRKVVKSARVIPCYLSIKNPYIIDENHADFSRDYDNDAFQIYFTQIKESGSIEKYRDSLIAAGFDGIALYHNTTGYYAQGEYAIYVAFAPEQIKIADGSNTTFDGSNPDIRLELGGSVESSAFKKWFAGSKIVNEDSSPKVVYHGTQNEFSVFDENKISTDSGNFGFLGKGFYFSGSKFIASAYGKLLPVYLAVKKPFEITKPLTEQEAKILNEVSQTFAFEEGNTPDQIYNGLSFSVPQFPEIAESISIGLQEHGYDGIIFKGTDKDEIVVFSPFQIKIADGINTTFDANNPDIYFFTGGSMENSNYLKLYHSSRISPFKIQQPRESFLSTEGNGIYASVDKVRHASAFGANQVDLNVKMPEKLIVADRQYFNDAFLNGNSDALATLQQPISNQDSAWLRINKQAIAKSGYLNKGTDATEYDLANLNTVLTEILKAHGYDAVFVHPTSDIEGGDFYVILDVNLIIDNPGINFELGGEITDINESSKWFMKVMQARKLARIILHKSNPKFKEQIAGIQDAIDKGYLYVKTYKRDEDSVFVRPTSKLLSLYFPEKSSVFSDGGKVNKDITVVINKLIESLGEEPFEINSGSCDAFAVLVKKEIPEVTILSDWDFKELSEPGAEERGGATLSVLDYTKKIIPPNFKGEYGHCWIYYNGKHYDAQLPEGSKDMFDIPIWHMALGEFTGKYDNRKMGTGGRTTDDNSFESNFSIGGKYWGSSAAGVLLIAKTTGRCLFMHRSGAVLEPYTWGIISGKIDKGETPEEAVYREAIEEIGESHAKILSIRPSYVFHATDDEFVFYNFIGVVEEEFEPTLNWESIGHKWATPNDLPEPLHPGVEKFLSEINLSEEIELSKLLTSNGKKSNLTPEQYTLVSPSEPLYILEHRIFNEKGDLFPVIRKIRKEYPRTIDSTLMHEHFAHEIKELFKPIIDEIRNTIKSDTIHLYRSKDVRFPDRKYTSWTLKKQIAESFSDGRKSRLYDPTESEIIEKDIPLDKIVAISNTLYEPEFMGKRWDDEYQSQYEFIVEDADTFEKGGAAGGKTITVKVPISSSLAWNAGMEALGDLAKLSEEEFIKAWKYVLAANYMFRTGIEISDYKHGKNHHVLHQAGAQHNVDAVNAEFKRRKLDKKYSLFIERKETENAKPVKSSIKSFEEIMLLPDLDSQRAALTKYILENPSVLIPVAFSGGKDSIAMVLHLLELGVPKSQMELWHHDVDGHGEELFDWHVTPEYCQAFADAIGIKLLFSYRAGGIVKRLLRNNEPRGDVYYQTPDYQWHMSPSDHTALNTGGRWPSKGNDMNARWCSSEVKIDVASQILSNDPRLQGTRENPMEILLCTGERHLESDKRATYAELQIYKKGSFTANRKVLSWRPIIEYSEEMVWELLKKWNIQPHPCYYLGWGRCSCQLCIFNEAPYWAASYEISPEKIIRIRQLEIITARYPKNEGKEHTLYDKMDIYEKATLANPVINLGTEEAKFWIKQATEKFTLPIFVQGEWKLPSGAFKKENCGAS